MSLSDPIGDLLTRIRNGQRAGLTVIESPTSKLRCSVLDVLKREGYIRDYSIQKQEANDAADIVRVELKYYEGAPVIRKIDRVSRPGQRVYTGIKGLGRVYNGLGISVLSTPRGVLSDNEARAANVGGELLCRVF